VKKNFYKTFLIEHLPSNMVANYPMSQENPKISVLVGSPNDLELLKGLKKILEEFDIAAEYKALSAHRVPDLTIDYVHKADRNGTQVFIAGAGMAAHLAGTVAAHTTKPVIGVPIKGPNLDGMDALLSTVQMPKGIPVATVAINSFENAAYLAIEILALNDVGLQKKLESYRKKLREPYL